jgi:hypothetical protein
MYKNLQIKDQRRKGAELMKILIPMKLPEQNTISEVATKYDRNKI